MTPSLRVRTSLEKGQSSIKQQQLLNLNKFSLTNISQNTSNISGKLLSNFRELYLIFMSYCMVLAMLSMIQVGGVNAEQSSLGDSFVNFTMTGNTITQNTNLIMDFNDQVYYKLSNYFLNLDIMKQSEPVFLCLCVATNCREESAKWSFNSLVELSQQVRSQSVSTQLKNNPIICNFENYYHTSTEKELYINMDSQIADLYKQNQHLGIFIRSSNNTQGNYVLNLLQKRNFCRRCQNVLSCDNSGCECFCQTGYMGQYCTESALIFKLGLGSDDLSTSSYQLQEKVFIKRIQLSPVQSSQRLRRFLDQQENLNSTSISSSLEDSQTVDPNILLTTQKSIQYIQLELQPLVEANSTETYNNFYFHFKKELNDKFKIYIADKFQINSHYLSQNDYVKEIPFNSVETELYIQAFAYNKDMPKDIILNNVATNATAAQNSTETTKVVKALLQHDGKSVQNFQFLIVNECQSSNSLCKNELEIQYSLKDFMNTVEIAEGASRIYLIVFLSLTIIGIIIFCAYVIYKSIKKNRNIAALAAARENKMSSEVQFKKIREKVDAELAEEEEMHKMRDQTAIHDIDSLKNMNNLQLHNGYSSEHVSNNKMLEAKNPTNKGNILDKQPNNQVNRFHQANIIKLQKQGSDGRIEDSQGGRQQNRMNSLQDTKSKMKQLYGKMGPNVDDKKISKTKKLLEQQQQAINSMQANKNNQQTAAKQQGYKSDLKIENVTTAHTMNNLIINNSNNFNELSSNNTTTRYNNYNQNGSMNNIIYLNKENNNNNNINHNMINSGDQNVSKQLSVPTEDSHALPSTNNNNANARPLSHYEFKREEADSTCQTNSKNHRKESNGFGQLTLNYITTNASNTINQLHSNQDFENQSPLEELIQGQKVGSLIRQDEKKYQKQLTTKSLKKFGKSPSFQNPTLKKNISGPTNATNTQSNLNESYSEEDLNSQKKQLKNNKILQVQAIDKEHKKQNQEEEDAIDTNKGNHSKQNSGEFDLSQQINIICDGYISEIKGIDGSKIQNHRRNILHMGNQEDPLMGDTLTNKTPQLNAFHSICQQEISNIMERQKNDMESNSDENAMEDLEKGVRLSQINFIGETDDNKTKLDDLKSFDFNIKIETPEIFFLNCPKCQSKQHEFQLKLSTVGPDGVRPNDKYCSVCLMKAELSEVKMADSF